MKKNKLLIALFFVPMLVSLSGCGNRLKGANAYMFKMTGNAFGEAIMTGFSSVMERYDEKCFDKSPSEANVGSQVQMIETLGMQQVKSISISASGTTGYDEVLKRIVAKGIKVVSTDSPVSPQYRITHVEHTRASEVGKWLARAATLIALGKDYQNPETVPDWDNKLLLKQPTIDALNEVINGDVEKRTIKFGIVSSTQDSPSQNEWIKYIQEELQKSTDEELKGKYQQAGIEINPQILYGDDETKKSKDKAIALINEGVDVIIAPTTVGMAACASVISDREGCKVKLTGLGMPSECNGSMPKGLNESRKDVECICPYMMLWDVIELGKVTAKAALEASNNNWEGNKVGQSFEFDVNNDGEMQTYTTEEADDGGTKIVALKPLPFTRFNIDYWKNIL